MNRIIFSALLLSGVAANAQQQQVGINTAEPKATLHVEAGASENKGVIIPRITAAEMKAMTTGLGADHHSMMTYLKEQMPAADRTGKLVDVADPGYYYYDNTTGVQKWKTFGGGEQDLRAVGNNDHITKDAGIGENGTSAGTGYRNIGIGQKALLNGTSGSDNIAIGSHSLKSLTVGHRNVAIGSNTLENNTTGANNVGIGSAFYFPNGGTISSNTNVGIGTTVYSLGNGGSMTGLGQNIGMGNSIYSLSKANAQFSGIQNTSIGQNIFKLQNGDLTGNYNIGMGNNIYTMRSGDMSASENIALGNKIYTLNKTAGAVFSGVQNTSIGYNIFNLTNGDLIGGANIGMGYQQYLLTSGNMAGNINIAIGRESYYVRSGDITNNATHNIALGSSIYRLANSGTSTFSGYSNIGIGRNLYYLSTGSFTGRGNIGMGNEAFYISSGDLSGSYNIGIGDRAMQVSGIAGDHNIALGYQTMYTNGKIAGTDNIAIGYYALHPNDNTNIGSYNIGIGNYALHTGMAKGNANIQLGNRSVGYTVTGQLNNVVAIGNEMDGLSTSNTDSNVILLGKTGSNGPKVGIGTYKPGAKLEVNNGTTAGAVKIVDGTQGAGKVLTSDADGLATWKSITLFTGTERIGAYHWGVGIALGNTNWNKIASITVPPGASMVYVKIHLLAGGLTSGAARAYVGKKDIGWNNSNTNDTPIGGSALFVTYHGIDPELQTSFIYNNTTNSNETLYLNLQSNQPTAARSGFEYPTGGSYLGTNWIENQFSAIPMN